MKKLFKSISVISAIVCSLIFSVCAYCDKYLPDEYTIYKNEDFTIQNFNTIGYNNQSKNSEQMVNGNTQPGSEIGNLTLLNIIPIKEVNVHTIENKYAVPCGNIFGVKLYTKGVVVINCDDITANGSMYNPGRECGLQAGDIILKMNDINITCGDDMKKIVEKSDGTDIKLFVERNGEYMETNITPVKSSDAGYYKVGLWIKDSCAGLGTMTFYMPEDGYFAALGHGICDADTNELLPLESAEIVNASIGSITKGADGVPGSINGYFDSSESIGQALINNETGLYGKVYNMETSLDEMEIANIQDVVKGKAQILCTLDENGPQLYDIEITHVDYDESCKTKNLEITATDERLIEKTGGIVQGMSGSPIIQNGKIVGAVTHVLIANSNKGYGIFAQNMYEEIEKYLR